MSRVPERDRSQSRPKVPEDLLRSIVAYFNPRRVILFGSAARDETHADSDIDLLVVVDDDLPADRLHWQTIHEARGGYEGAVDLIPCREATFRDRVDIIGSLPWIAATEGVVVYERAEAA